MLYSKMGVMDQDQTILVCPSDMKQFRLAPGMLCLVNGIHVLISRPHKEFSPGTVLLPAILAEGVTGSDCDEDSIVTIQRFYPSGCEAELVHIELESQYRYGDERIEEFLGVLKCRMEYRYITENIKYASRFMGLKWVFLIKSIHCFPQQPLEARDLEKPSSSADGDSEDLGKKFSTLDLSGASDGDDSSMSSLHSTPLKQSVATSNFTTSTPVGCSMDQEPDQNSTPILSGKDDFEDFSRFVQVTQQTRFVIQNKSDGVENKVMYDSLGGEQMDDVIKLLQYCLSPLPLPTSQRSQSDDEIVPSGIFLSGPHGTGKSMLVQAIVNELGIRAYYVPDTVCFWEHEKMVRKLKEIFRCAYRRSPSLIILEHLDLMFPCDHASPMQQTTLRVLLGLMDKAAERSPRQTCVIGITSEPQDCDPALRQRGRLSFSISTNLPTSSDRLQIMKKLLKEMSHTISESDLKGFSGINRSYTGADLSSIVRRSRDTKFIRTGDGSPVLTIEDLEEAASDIPPTAARAFLYEVPEVQWSDIGGQEEVKWELQCAMEKMMFPEKFKALNLLPSPSCLLYGPPGCSKTMMAKALATVNKCTFMEMDASRLFHKYLGESEKAVIDVFRKARSSAPCIIFIDEIECMAGGGDICRRVMNTITSELDHNDPSAGVMVLAATNRPDLIDASFLGRMGSNIYVPLPDFTSRKEILQIIKRTMPFAPEVCLDVLAKQTENYSGAEVTELCRKAALQAIRENNPDRLVHVHHFDAALQKVLPQTTDEMVGFFQLYKAKGPRVASFKGQKLKTSLRK